MDAEQIMHEGKLWAVIIRAGQVPPGVHFFTPDDNSLQVGQQMRPKGTVIAPHAHCEVKTGRTGFLQEVLHIQQGRLKTIFYTHEGQRLTERVLEAGDTILLIRGGHGFEALDDVRMLEIKMGPYDPASKKNLEVKP
ncbi:MAG TPA: hypothetical protein VI955_02280 [Candidatus Omnitrophota bacterium]|nr:hypothetical protein [Candidatus Omnitrophota bacterium]